MIRVTGLFVYPVKGLAGISVSSWPVDRRGLQHDRRWMLVDGDGLFVSQRTVPRICLFRTCVDDDGLSIASPEGDTLNLSFDHAPREAVSVTIWRSECRAERIGEGADAWLSERLGVSVRLVYMPDHEIRPTNPDFSQPGDHVSFADGYPILVISEPSLADLNGRMEVPLPMSRFRPNVVVDGCGPFGEDAWRAFRIGDSTYRVVKPCARCAVPTIDQTTGISGQEPLRTLATYRRSEAGQVMFGMNVIPDARGHITVGDTVELIA